jgi:hypothetical protein
MLSSQPNTSAYGQRSFKSIQERRIEVFGICRIGSGDAFAIAIAKIPGPIAYGAISQCTLIDKFCAVGTGSSCCQEGCCGELANQHILSNGGIAIGGQLKGCQLYPKHTIGSKAMVYGIFCGAQLWAAVVEKPYPCAHLGIGRQQCRSNQHGAALQNIPYRP